MAALPWYFRNTRMTVEGGEYIIHFTIPRWAIPFLVASVLWDAIKRKLGMIMEAIE